MIYISFTMNKFAVRNMELEISPFGKVLNEDITDFERKVFETLLECEQSLEAKYNVSKLSIAMLIHDIVREERNEQKRRKNILHSIFYREIYNTPFEKIRRDIPEMPVRRKDTVKAIHENIRNLQIANEILNSYYGKLVNHLEDYYEIIRMRVNRNRLYHVIFHGMV